jgi:hypothetical protein
MKNLKGRNLFSVISVRRIIGKDVKEKTWVAVGWNYLAQDKNHARLLRAR